MNGSTAVEVLMIGGIALALLGSIVGLIVVAVKGRRGGRDGTWDSRPPRERLKLRAGGGLGRGSSH